MGVQDMRGASVKQSLRVMQHYGLASVLALIQPIRHESGRWPIARLHLPAFYACYWLLSSLVCFAGVEPVTRSPVIAPRLTRHYPYQPRLSSPIQPVFVSSSRR